MDTAGEALVAKFGKMNGAGQSAYGILTDADLPWPKFKPATGEEITLDQSAYTKYRESNDRAERKRVLDSFVGTFKTFERSLGVLLYSQLKQDAVYSEVRKYPDRSRAPSTPSARRSLCSTHSSRRPTPTCRRCTATFGCVPSCSASPIWATTTSIRRS